MDSLRSGGAAFDFDFDVVVAFDVVDVVAFDVDVANIVAIDVVDVVGFDVDDAALDDCCADSVTLDALVNVDDDETPNNFDAIFDVGAIVVVVVVAVVVVVFGIDAVVVVVVVAVTIAFGSDSVIGVPGGALRYLLTN